MTAVLLAACGTPRPTTTVHFAPADSLPAAPEGAPLDPPAPRPGETVDYAPASPSSGDVLNPERGFMVDVDLVGGRDIDTVRARGYTLGYAGVRLDAFRKRPLTDGFRRALDRGFAHVRAAGIKVVLRFVYNDSARGADASKWQILAHIDQLRPVLEANADVIAVMDAGFIGAWGEWHSSTNGLDNARDRGDILYAVLHALPATRAVTLRSPRYKVDAYGGVIAEGNAWNGSDAARVGHHNSCFLASDSDLGTYPEPIEQWKDLVAADGRFAPVGGETCQWNPPRTDCPTAVAELARLHWSFLNALYHKDVLGGWREQGCYDDIARHLGYRLEVRSVTFDRDVAPGSTLHVAVKLVNTGYAAMFNARPLFFVLDDQRIWVRAEPRGWQPGEEVTVKAELPVPATMAPGHHRLGLWLPDADPRLQAPEHVDHYSVRFANTAWDSPVNVLTDRIVVREPDSPRAPGQGR